MEHDEIVRLAHRYVGCQDLAGLGGSADDVVASVYSAVDQLAFVGAGVVEDVVRRGNLIALRALVDAARPDRRVRRSLGYAWLTARHDGSELGEAGGRGGVAGDSRSDRIVNAVLAALTAVPCERS
jgi:hypothetical protein